MKAPGPQTTAAVNLLPSPESQGALLLPAFLYNLFFPHSLFFLKSFEVTYIMALS